MSNETMNDAKALYEVLENMLSDLYLFGLAEIKLEDIQAGSAHDAMKTLKRLQYKYRGSELRTLAIACKQRTPETDRFSSPVTERQG